METAQQLLNCSITGQHSVVKDSEWEKYITEDYGWSTDKPIHARLSGATSGRAARPAHPVAAQLKLRSGLDPGRRHVQLRLSRLGSGLSAITGSAGCCGCQTAGRDEQGGEDGAEMHVDFFTFADFAASCFRVVRDWNRS